MPLQDLMLGKFIVGPRIIVCRCGHEPTWHKKMDRACGYKSCSCSGFKTGEVAGVRTR